MTRNDEERPKAPEAGASVQRSWQPGAPLIRLEDDMLDMAKVGNCWTSLRAQLIWPR